jgi:hypothetical protein
MTATKRTKFLHRHRVRRCSLASCRDRVGQSQPGLGPAAPGKSPFRYTDRLDSDPSSRSGREPLAVLIAVPRSGLAAFSRPPSVLPCGFPSGFPRSHLAAVAWASPFREDIDWHLSRFAIFSQFVLDVNCVFEARHGVEDSDSSCLLSYPSILTINSAVASKAVGPTRTLLGVKVLRLHLRPKQDMLGHLPFSRIP